MALSVVLLQPEIPQNAGNIARTCACANVALHLVHPMGFQLTERRLTRAGMDYLQDVELSVWPSTEAFLDAHGDDDLHLFTGHASTPYTQASYLEDAYLLFGRESRGIDADVLAAYESRCVRIPMAAGKRSLNLSNAVAVAVYEVSRMRGFAGLS